MVLNSVHDVSNPPLRFVMLRNARRAKTSVWDNAEVLLPVIIVWQGYGVNNEEKVSLSRNFYFG